MAKSKEGIVIVFDVGISEHSDKNYLSTFEEAKDLICMIIQRKIFSESKDEIAMVFGNSPSDSESASDEKNTVKVFHNLQPPNWKLIERVKELKCTAACDDSIRSNVILCAIELLKDLSNMKKFTSRRILFISNFDGFICDDKVDDICNEMKQCSIDLNVIVPNTFLVEEMKSEQDMDPLKAEYRITKILNEVNGDCYSFSDVRQALTFYQTKKKMPFPWNANLEIGELSVPITAYIKTTEMKTEPWKKAYAFKPEAKIENRCAYNINDESQTAVSSEDLIPAYKFGCTLVPFSEEDKKNMNYESGEKGIKVLGFTKSKSIQRHHCVGDNTYYVFGRKNDECACTRLAAFTQALHSTEMVGIARYVYNQRSSPKIGFLFPKIKENYECLIFISMPFMEDLRHYIFPSLDLDSKNIPTEEQLDAIDRLITDMDLTVPIDEDGEEFLKPKNTVNPYLQRLFQCLEFRALNPEKPLPEIEPHIEALIIPPPEILKRAEKSIKSVSSLFPLKKTEVKQKAVKSHIFSNEKDEDSVKKQKLDDSLFEQKFVPETSLLDAVTDKICEVGSINPVRDFQYLVSNKVLPFDKICDQLIDVVLKYLKESAQLRMYHLKILSICKEFRLASLKENNCNKYNSFMTNLKNNLLDCDEDLWNKIKDEKISLISDQELTSSTTSVEQANLFLTSPSQLENKNASTVESLEIKMEDDDEDLLDQL